MFRVSPAKIIRAVVIVLFAGSVCAARLEGQTTGPPTPNHVFHSKSERDLTRELAAHHEPMSQIDATKIYTLAELTDIAESQNPETRVAWQDAKARAATLGIVRSSLFPTMAAVALGETIRQAALIGEYFHRQTLGIFEPFLHVEYLVFDVGGRSGTIDIAKANLLAADLSFNDTHRKII